MLANCKQYSIVATLYEHLDNVAADAASPLEGPPSAAASGHVCSEFHEVRSCLPKWLPSMPADAWVMKYYNLDSAEK
jgi:hypothetical protein